MALSENSIHRRRSRSAVCGSDDGAIRARHTESGGGRAGEMPAVNLSRPDVPPVRIPPQESPRLHVVIDTEEEFDWDAPYSRGNVSVSAMRHIGRAQAVFDRYGIVPTYVIDYPVATQAAASEPLAALAADGRCEIGAHLHPWVNPPFAEEATVAASFTGNLPAALQRAKISRLREAICAGLAVEQRMFKAGRYGLSRQPIRILEDLDFDIDGSVCPRFDFRSQAGPSYEGWDSSLRFLTPRLLEIPCTVDYTGWAGPLRASLHRAALSPPALRLRAPGVLARLRATNRIMLSPEGNTLAEMCALTAALIDRGQRHFTLSFHSPSVEPGHTPYVRTAHDLEQFLRTIEQYCEYFLGPAGGHPITSSGCRVWIQDLQEPSA